LTRVELVQIRDAAGTLLAHRANFETTTTEKIHRAILPDGRVAPVTLVGGEDIPWDGHGVDFAAGLIVDPSVQASDDRVGDEQPDGERPQWFEAATGEPL